MLWVIVILAIFALFLDSAPGKIIFGAGVIAIGLLLLRWITGFALFVFLAKCCAAIIVIITVVMILIAIFN